MNQLPTETKESPNLTLMQVTNSRNSRKYELQPTPEEVSLNLISHGKDCGEEVKLNSPKFSFEETIQTFSH